MPDIPWLSVDDLRFGKIAMSEYIRPSPPQWEV